MKKSIVFFILTIGWLIEGCYEDKGHYDYIRISGPEVTGIEKFYTVYDGGNFDIHPSVTWTYGELENYTYSWKVDGISVSDKAELTEQVNPNRSLENDKKLFLMTAIRKTALYMLDS